MQTETSGSSSVVGGERRCAQVDVISFDLMRRDYQDPTVLERWFPGRLQVVAGDSGRQVPRFLNGRRDCDLVHPSVPGREYVDLENLRAHSKIGALVMPTAYFAERIFL